MGVFAGRVPIKEAMKKRAIYFFRIRLDVLNAETIAIVGVKFVIFH